jgi:hypothetical protein
LSTFATRVPVGSAGTAARSDRVFHQFLDDWAASEQVAHILTNLGVVDVENFKTENAAESITVTYHKTDDARPIHAYYFDRPKGNKVASGTSSGPLYFTLHNRWFIKQ